MMESFPHIYLASSSPRRSTLLREAHIPFTVFPVDVEETYPENMNPLDVAGFLAEKKAKKALESKPDSLVLAADSIVVLDGEIFGKPGDYDDAFKMLERLSGRSHTVVTGICLTDGEKMVSENAETRVHMYPLSETEIDYYLNEFEPYDKAGGYGIQDWIGWCKIKGIEGSFSNVMGLPVHLVYRALKEFRP